MQTAAAIDRSGRCEGPSRRAQPLRGRRTAFKCGTRPRAATGIRQLIIFSAVILFVSGFLERACSAADDWKGPFGGSFSATFTATSDYSFAGISSNNRQPAFQASLDYRTPDLTSSPKSWFYAGVWGTNTVLPAGPGVEIDLSTGLKVKPVDKLKIDVGYLRYLFPGFTRELGYEYGEFQVSVDYDFGPAELGTRVKFSPNAFADSGPEWNKRLMLTVPLDFLRLGDVKVKTYGAVGNLWVDRFQQYGIGANEYWYWQFGLVSSAFGLDVTLAYTDTNLEPQQCGGTANCAGRVFVSVTKAF